MYGHNIKDFFTVNLYCTWSKYDTRPENFYHGVKYVQDEETSVEYFLFLLGKKHNSDHTVSY